jgi:hypothetical protein
MNRHERRARASAARKTHQPRTIPLHPQAREVVAQQHKLFKETFGREPGPNDPIFFDPDITDRPVPISKEKMDKQFDEMCDAVAKSGQAPPEIVHAMRKTRRIVTVENVKHLTAADRKEWMDAVNEYRMQHPEGSTP